MRTAHGVRSDPGRDPETGGETVGIISLIGAIVVIIVILKLLGLW